MRRAKTPVVRAGGDWAAALGRRMGNNTGDLSHHAVEQTRQRLRLALLGFTMVFTVLVGRLTYLTAMGENTGLSLAAKAAQTQERPIITDRHGVVLATQISTTTLGASYAYEAWRAEHGDRVCCRGRALRRIRRCRRWRLSEDENPPCTPPCAST